MYQVIEHAGLPNLCGPKALKEIVQGVHSNAPSKTRKNPKNPATFIARRLFIGFHEALLTPVRQSQIVTRARKLWQSRARTRTIFKIGAESPIGLRGAEGPEASTKNIRNLYDDSMTMIPWQRGYPKNKRNGSQSEPGESNRFGFTSR